MEPNERRKILNQILWDYSIPLEDVDAVLKGERERAGHYTQEALFTKILESYSWFTIIRIFSLIEVKKLLTTQAISRLRSPSLRRQFEFVRERLQQVIPTSG